MKTIYIVMEESAFQGDTIVRVFSDYAMAEAFVVDISKNYTRGCYSIDEWDVMEPVE